MHVVHLDDKGVDVADLIVEIVVEAGFVGCYKVERMRAKTLQVAPYGLVAHGYDTLEIGYALAVVGSSEVQTRYLVVQQHLVVRVEVRARRCICIAPTSATMDMPDVKLPSMR